jgi:hypothetical protein
VEVTREQSEGNSPIDEDVLSSFKQRTKVVVATYQGGPISILPSKNPVEEKSNDSQSPKP